MNNNSKKLITTFLIIVTVLLFFRVIGIENYINFQTIKENREYLLNFVTSYYWFSVFIYIVTYIVVAALSVPIAAPLTLIGCFIFGVVPTVLYTNIGATLGAVLAFLIIRYFLGVQIQKAYAKKLIHFNENIERYGANYLLLARFIAIIPFFLVNILAGLTNISFKTFVWTTSLGIIPGSLIYAYAGKNIISIDSTKEIFSSKIILIFIVLILFGLGSLFFQKRSLNFLSLAQR